MPLINEYQTKNKASFKKKSYRPWNIEDDVRPKKPEETNSTQKVSNISEFSSHTDEVNKEQIDNKQHSNYTQKENKQKTNQKHRRKKL